MKNDKTVCKHLLQVPQHGTSEITTNVSKFEHFPFVTSKHLSQIKGFWVHLTVFLHEHHLGAFEPGPGLGWISQLRIILKVAV